MREIKFRGYNEKRGVWLYGSHIINRGAHFVAPDEFANGQTWEDYEVIPETVGQFTGMYDKQGRELYEGDIVTLDEKTEWEFFGGTGIVSYIDYQFVYEIPRKRKADGRRVYSELIMLTPTIVGNVTDNPELLKGDDK